MSKAVGLAALLLRVCYYGYGCLYLGNSDPRFYSCWGLSTPQCSVDPDELNVASKKIAEACKARGIVGYFAIDFVTYIHPKTVSYLSRFDCTSFFTRRLLLIIPEYLAYKPGV